MWERLTEKARKAVYYAQEEAERLESRTISTEHLLLGILKEDCVATEILQRLGLSADDLRAAVERAIAAGEKPEQKETMTLSANGKRAIDMSYIEAREMDHAYIGTEHLLLGLIVEKEGVAAKEMATMGVNADAVRKIIQQMEETRA